MDTNNNSTVVYFHVGRGGRFNNQGHKTYEGLRDLQSIIHSCSDNLFLYNEDENGNELPTEEWTLQDCGEKILLEGKDAIESRTGILDFDGDYNTDICKELDDLTSSEVEIIAKQILDGSIIDYNDELIKYVCCESQEIWDKYSYSVFTFNGDPASVETNEQIAEIVLELLHNSADELDDSDGEDFTDAMERLDLTPDRNVKRILSTGNMLLALYEDFD